MAYVRGEEKITIAVREPGMIEEVFDMIKSMSKGFSFGSTRFSSHGYVTMSCKSLSLWRIQRRYPKIEFKIQTDKNEISIMFRTQGSTGWYPDE